MLSFSDRNDTTHQNSLRKSALACFIASKHATPTQQPALESLLVYAYNLQQQRVPLQRGRLLQPHPEVEPPEMNPCCCPRSQRINNNLAQKSQAQYCKLQYAGTQ
jgi:hypothetical protein